MSIDNLYAIFIKLEQRLYTDTRQPIHNALFFALKGPGFNGNKFAKQALDQGAAYVVIDEEVEDCPTSQIIVVENVLHVLQQLASFHRQQSKSKVLAIGGSNGKTTTKELLKLVLEYTYKVHATKGNFNNHIGLPLTLLQMPVDTEVVLLELGTNQTGDIAELCAICDPDMGLITNIGKEHLQGFGSIEGVAKEESVLFDYLIKKNGVCFINQDDVWLMSMSKRVKHAAPYSVGDFVVLSLAPHIKATSMNGQTFSSELAGKHNLINMAAARRVGLFFGIPEIAIANALASYKPDNMRSQWIKTDNNLVFLDAYNANPSSMELALLTMAELLPQPVVVILGDMFELGSHDVQEHKAILAIANSYDFKMIITVGNVFSKVNHHRFSFETLEDLLLHLLHNPINNTTILLKGSRGMKLEKLLEAL